jgi:glycosyltransferase involved in cell wall biosynthesis
MLFIGEQLGLGVAPRTLVACMPLIGEREASLLEDASLTIQSMLEDPQPPEIILVAGNRAIIEDLALRLGDQANELVCGLDVTPASSAAEVLDAVVRATDSADLAIVAPGTRVHVGWWRRLQSAAHSDTTVASASALLAGKERVAEEIERGSLRIYPKIATMGPYCVYVRREALDLLCAIDQPASLRDWLSLAALRLKSLGMVHVVADDVAVLLDDGPEEVSVDLDGPSNETQAIIESDGNGALRRALRHAAEAASALSVTVDARSLTPAVGGTQTYVLALILALAEMPRLRLRVLVPEDLSDRAHSALQARQLEMITTEQALAGAQISDLVHRPQQVFSVDDFKLLERVGRRVVLTHQDLIAYHNHSYHENLDAWREHRRATQLGLGTADQVIFFSEHARNDALAEDLLPAERAHVVGIGAEQMESFAVAAAPAEITAEPPFLLCLGADYSHKNRPFAIRLLAALHELGWPGRLVLAGPHVPYGSSRLEERSLLEGSPDLAESVIDLGPVDEPTKLSLSQSACAFVYPTLYEGFGLLPLEAARWRKPCLFAAQASLVELAGQAATLQPWNPQVSARTVLPLLSDSTERAQHIDRLTKLHAPSWAHVAQRLLDVYELASSGMGPTVPGWQELDPEGYASIERSLEYHRNLAQEYQDAYHDLQARVKTGLPLIDHGGLLSPAQQRGLMRVAAHKPLGPIILGPLKLLGR